MNQISSLLNDAVGFENQVLGGDKYKTSGFGHAEFGGEIKSISLPSGFSSLNSNPLFISENEADYLGYVDGSPYIVRINRSSGEIIGTSALSDLQSNFYAPESFENVTDDFGLTMLCNDEPKWIPVRYYNRNSNQYVYGFLNRYTGYCHEGSAESSVSNGRKFYFSDGDYAGYVYGYSSTKVEVTSFLPNSRTSVYAYYSAATRYVYPIGMYDHRVYFLVSTSQSAYDIFYYDVQSNSIRKIYSGTESAASKRIYHDTIGNGMCAAYKDNIAILTPFLRSEGYQANRAPILDMASNTLIVSPESITYSLASYGLIERALPLGEYNGRLHFIVHRNGADSDAISVDLSTYDIRRECSFVGTPASDYMLYTFKVGKWKIADSQTDNKIRYGGCILDFKKNICISLAKYTANTMRQYINSRNVIFPALFSNASVYSPGAVTYGDITSDSHLTGVSYVDTSISSSHYAVYDGTSSIISYINLVRDPNE